MSRSFAFAAATAATPTTSQERSPANLSVNVRDFGAVGDGATDDTEAFNRATRADDLWSEDIGVAIRVPAGRYRLRGTVFLRRGQSLTGEGLSSVIDATGAVGSTFILGRRRSGRARGTPDPGGSPVSVNALMCLGGSADAGLFYIATQGFHVRNLFLSAVGLGLEIVGADGIISNVTIDQCLTGIYLERSQNLIFSNIDFYLANYGITFGSLCNDITVSNSLFSYTKFASVLLAEKATDISALRLTDCTFTSNETFSSFQANIYSRADRCDLQIDGCTFRNIPGYAIWQGAGVGLLLTVQNSVFDGLRTNPAYTQSGKAGGIRTGYGNFVIRGCSFRNLSAKAVRIGAGLESLSIEGGTIASVASETIGIDESVQGPIRIRDLAGVARVDVMDKNQHVRLPSLGVRTRWTVVVNSRDPDAQAAAAQWNVSERFAQRTGGGAEIDKVVRTPDGSLSFMIPVAQFGVTPVIVDANGYG